MRLWRDVTATFESQVLGPCFEAMARYWSLHFADSATLGGPPGHVGPTKVASADGSETELDVLVAAAAGAEEAGVRPELLHAKSDGCARRACRHSRRL